MGGRDKERKSEPCRKSSTARVPCTTKSPSVCKCAQTFDHSFPYKDLPPPAPPDGRSDLWELQFCRWWGWNWVKKRESVIRLGLEDEAAKRSVLATKPRDFRETTEIPVKLPAPKSKRASFSCKEAEHRAHPHLQAISPKEQFKTMCKCLLGKKKTPGEMATLFNTPSTSMIGLKQCERASPPCKGAGRDQTKGSCEKRHKRRERSREGARIRSSSRPKPCDRRTPPCSDQSSTSGIETVLCESIYSHKRESSTEESVEYLTFKLNPATSDGACPCRNKPPPPTKEVPVRDYQGSATSPAPTTTDHQCTADLTPPTFCKGTQTCPAMEDNSSDPSPPIKTDTVATEKMVKVRSRKHKTICIMVCCCGSCKQNNASGNPLDNDDLRNTIRALQTDAVVGGTTTQVTTSGTHINATSAMQTVPEKGAKKVNCNKINCPRLGSRTAGTNVEEKIYKFDTFTTNAVTISPLNTKQLSKFGTPSKNYPWMQTTDSAETTISLDNIGIDTNSSFNSWLDTDIQTSYHPRALTLPDFVDLEEDLSCFKKAAETKKSSIEDRILLDAVCDAILQEHDHEPDSILESIQLKDTRHDYKANRDYKELGILCDVKKELNAKTDVYTEYSKVLIDTEDVGTQLSRILAKQSKAAKYMEALTSTEDDDVLTWLKQENMETAMKNCQVSTFDNIMNSIFSDSDDTAYPKYPQKTQETLEKEAKKYHAFVAKNPSFTKTGLLPVHPDFISYKRSVKRGSSASSRGAESNKKFKQDDKESVGEEPEGKKVFNKIDDMIRKSRARTEDIQKLLGSTKKPIPLEKSQSNLLENVHVSLSKSCGEFNKTTSNEMSVQCTNLEHELAPINCDTSFTERTVEPCGIEKKFESNKHNRHINNNKEIQHKEQVNENTEGQSIAEESVLKKLSKLSVRSFMVCDERSRQDLAARPSRMAVGSRKAKKRISSAASLIPVRK